MCAKVVPCTGDGLAVDDVTGGITVYGPRKLAWRASGADCNIDQHNGLKVDPSTHKMWTSPDCSVNWTQHGVSSAIHYEVVRAGTHAYTPYSINMTSRACTKTYVSVHLTDGFSAFFCSPGNYWVHRCNVKATIDGASTHATSEPAAFIAPSSTLWTGFGHPSWLMSRILQPGQKLEVTISYFLDVLAYSAGPATNGADIRLPNCNMTMWSYPL